MEALLYLFLLQVANLIASCVFPTPGMPCMHRILALGLFFRVSEYLASRSFNAPLSTYGCDSVNGPKSYVR